MSIAVCRDCEGVFTAYTVNSDTWEAIGGHWTDGLHLCLDCLERRLGRPLTLDDFPEGASGEKIPVNRTLMYAYQMGRRYERGLDRQATYKHDDNCNVHAAPGEDCNCLAYVRPKVGEQS